MYKLPSVNSPYARPYMTNHLCYQDRIRKEFHGSVPTEMLQMMDAPLSEASRRKFGLPASGSAPSLMQERFPKGSFNRMNNDSTGFSRSLLGSWEGSGGLNSLHRQTFGPVARPEETSSNVRHMIHSLKMDSWDVQKVDWVSTHVLYKFHRFDVCAVDGPAVKLYHQLGVKHEPLTLIPPQFETPMPALQPAARGPRVFPPCLREPPPPSLDLFDLDEQFASERVRLACTDDDLDFYIRQAGEILGVSQKLGDKRSSKDPAKKIVEPAAQFRGLGFNSIDFTGGSGQCNPTSKMRIVRYIFKELVGFKKMNQDMVPSDPVSWIYWVNLGEVEKRLLRRFISEDLAEKLLMKELKELRAENPQDCEEVDTTEVDEEMTPTEDREYEANKSPTVRQNQVPSGYQGTATDWLEAGLYDCALACEYEGIRPTLKTIRSMCYLLKKLNELPDWIFMSEQPIRSQGKVSKNFRLCEQDDEQTDILFDVKPPSYHVEQLDKCSRSDLLGACLMALPVRCPKQGDWYLGLAGALREELVKKPRLYEIRCVIKTLEESGQAFVHDCGRWRCELVKLEAASEEKLDWTFERLTHVILKAGSAEQVKVLLAAGATMMQPAAVSAESNDELIALLRQDRELLDPLPKMLKLGDNLGEIQVLELMDEIASDLQVADEISYVKVQEPIEYMKMAHGPVTDDAASRSSQVSLTASQAMSKLDEVLKAADFHMLLL
ncbi:Intraflagellar transport protein 52-like [Symbiodinium microadriaticum]|uniref:Intraflagellar transport protein 52-like n=1 Tax=Symbiodinium microadriaticum TaxID=2951 RepID=A0A1Q9CNP1_SYMMI|nr:Intraflagellar transport protein 52-like [Symbiodinium microadriaticum]CAE7764041.1 IFT52 [Symbiodinium sp. KB8]